MMAILMGAFIIVAGFCMDKDIETQVEKYIEKQ